MLFFSGSQLLWRGTPRGVHQSTTGPRIKTTTPNTHTSTVAMVKWLETRVWRLKNLHTKHAKTTTERFDFLLTKNIVCPVCPVCQAADMIFFWLLEMLVLVMCWVWWIDFISLSKVNYTSFLNEAALIRDFGEKKNNSGKTLEGTAFSLRGP